MATTNQLVDRIKRRLSRPNVTALDATIIDELNATQENLEGRSTLPSFIITTSPITLVAEDDQISVAADLSTFIRLIDDSPVQVSIPDADEPWAPVKKFITEEELKGRYPGHGSLPLGWAFIFPLITIRPIPDTTVNLRLRYYSRITAMAAGNSTLWTVNAPDLLVAQTGMEVAQQVRDLNALAYFKDKYKTANKDYIQRLSAEEMAGLSTSRGED
jgi:hypothetical protein